MELVPGNASSGTVRKIDSGRHAGKWVADFQYVDRDKIAQRCKLVAPKEKDAYAKMAERKRLLAETFGGGIDGRKTRLHALADKWFGVESPSWSREKCDKMREAISFIKRQWPNQTIGDYLDDPDELGRYNTIAGRQATIAVRILRHVFGYAVKGRHLPYNPALELKALKYTPAIRRGLLPAEVWSFLAACETAEEHFAARAIFITGTRIGELLGLQRDDFDAANGRLYIRRKVPRRPDYSTGLKTSAGLRKLLGGNQKARIMRLDPPAAAVFAERIAYLDSIGYTGPWLLPNRAHTGPWAIDDFRNRVFKKVLARANKGTPSAQRFTFVQHEARHTHISYRMIVGDPFRDSIAEIGQEVGQATSSVTHEYAHYVAQRTAALQLEALKILGRATCTGDLTGDLSQKHAS